MINLDVDIKKEELLKRYNPEYIINLLEDYFRSIDNTYPASFNEALKYRKRLKNFFAKEDIFIEAIRQMALISKKASENAIEATANSEKVMKVINNEEEEFDRLSKKAKKLITISSGLVTEMQQAAQKIEEFEYDKEEFQALILIREDFRFNNKLGNSAVSYLLKNSFFDFITKMILFSLSFLLAFYVGDFLEKEFSILGDVISKLIPALIFFFTSDKAIKWIESLILWKRVQYLYNKTVELEGILIQKHNFLEILNAKIMQK